MKPLMTLIAALTLSTPAYAEAVVCMEPDEMKAALIDWYQEEPVGPPKSLDDSTVQLWASDEGGTWSMVRTYSESSACVVAQGDDWTSPERVPLRLSLLTD